MGAGSRAGQFRGTEESTKPQDLPTSVFWPQTHPPRGYRVAAAAPEVTADAAKFSGRRDHLLFFFFFRGDHLFLSLLERKKTFP